MRIPKNEVTIREAFLTDMLKTEGNMTVREIQEKLVAKFGKQMNPKRVLQLRHTALTQLVAPTTDTNQS